MVKTEDNGVLCMVYHSETATFLMTSALTLHGLFTPTTLEAMAYREALALVHDLNIQRVCMATDYLEVIKNLNLQYLGEYVMIIREIKERASLFLTSSFKQDSKRLQRRGTSTCS
jgi:hypothetical protein